MCFGGISFNYRWYEKEKITNVVKSFQSMIGVRMLLPSGIPSFN